MASVDPSKGNNKKKEEGMPLPPTFVRRKELFRSLGGGELQPSVGLKNLGATCYMNSLLQTMFHTPELREAILEWNFEPKQRHGKNVAYQLQLLFARMCQTDVYSSLDPTHLVKSFGMGDEAHRQQHDVQELNRVLLSVLQETEERFRRQAAQQQSPAGKDNSTGCNTPASSPSAASPTVQEIYEGKLTNFTQCQNCGLNNRHPAEPFQDVSVVIEGVKELTEALERYVKPEVIEGARCDACCVEKDDRINLLKGVTFGSPTEDAPSTEQTIREPIAFASMPSVLTIQLQRLVYNFMTDRRDKISQEVRIPAQLDMHPYLDQSLREQPGATTARGDAGDSAQEADTQNREMKYHLHSVIAHRGTAYSGHYFAFVCVDSERQIWLKCDDETVTLATEYELEEVLDPALWRKKGDEEEEEAVRKDEEEKEAFQKEQEEKEKLAAAETGGAEAPKTEEKEQKEEKMPSAPTETSCATAHLSSGAQQNIAGGDDDEGFMPGLFNEEEGLGAGLFDDGPKGPCVPGYAGYHSRRESKKRMVTALAYYAIYRRQPVALPPSLTLPEPKKQQQDESSGSSGRENTEQQHKEEEHEPSPFRLPFPFPSGGNIAEVLTQELSEMKSNRKELKQISSVVPVGVHYTPSNTVNTEGLPTTAEIVAMLKSSKKNPALKDMLWSAPSGESLSLWVDCDEKTLMTEVAARSCSLLGQMVECLQQEEGERDSPVEKKNRLGTSLHAWKAMMERSYKEGRWRFRLHSPTLNVCGLSLVHDDLVGEDAGGIPPTGTMWTAATTAEGSFPHLAIECLPEGDCPQFDQCAEWDCKVKMYAVHQCEPKKKAGSSGSFSSTADLLNALFEHPSEVLALEPIVTLGNGGPYSAQRGRPTYTNKRGKGGDTDPYGNPQQLHYYRNWTVDQFLEYLTHVFEINIPESQNKGEGQYTLFVARGGQCFDFPPPPPEKDYGTVAASAATAVNTADDATPHTDSPRLSDLLHVNDVLYLEKVCTCKSVVPLFVLTQNLVEVKFSVLDLEGLPLVSQGTVLFDGRKTLGKLKEWLLTTVQRQSTSEESEGEKGNVKAPAYGRLSIPFEEGVDEDRILSQFPNDKTTLADYCQLLIDDSTTENRNSSSITVRTMSLGTKTLRVKLAAGAPLKADQYYVEVFQTVLADEENSGKADNSNRTIGLPVIKRIKRVVANDLTTTDHLIQQCRSAVAAPSVLADSSFELRPRLMEPKRTSSIGVPMLKSLVKDCWTPGHTTDDIRVVLQPVAQQNATKDLTKDDLILHLVLWDSLVEDPKQAQTHLCCSGLYPPLPSRSCSGEPLSLFKTEFIVSRTESAQQVLARVQAALLPMTTPGEGQTNTPPADCVHTTSNTEEDTEAKPKEEKEAIVLDPTFAYARAKVYQLKAHDTVFKLPWQLMNPQPTNKHLQKAVGVNPFRFDHEDILLIRLNKESPWPFLEDKNAEAKKKKKAEDEKKAEDAAAAKKKEKPKEVGITIQSVWDDDEAAEECGLQFGDDGVPAATTEPKQHKYWDTLIYSSSEHASIAEVCPICMCDFEDGDDKLALLPLCHHGFHVACLEPWIIEQGQRSCPQCSDIVSPLD